ncbi:hypothetical protein V9T40_000039 [Parthenolecanium corni]|uniref:Beclin-1 n=1 Tax=Parthenolecanium corni TaxID=536013 RepID=A0AAN9Y460_9HEMI
MAGNVNVSFVCQRCLQPLFLDPTFGNVDEHRKAELSVPLFSSPEADLDLQEASFDHFVPAFHLSDSENGSQNGSNSFTILGDGETSNLSQQMKRAVNIFDIISGNTEINHPLCEECTDTLLDIMDQHLRMIDDDCLHYKLYLQKLNKTEDFDLQALTKELEDLQEEEIRLTDELKSLQEEEKKVDEDIVKAEKEKERLETDEERFWREYNKYSREKFVLEDEFRSLDYQLNYAQVHLERLKKNNVFNTTFHIWHKGHFGTINNFRLGRLPTAPVDWSEINAAWGQTTLLLVSLARKCNLTFERYRLIPYGSHSYVEVLGDHKELPLHGSGGFRFLLNPKFDSAMVAFLDCLQQFKEEVEKRKSGFNLPYRMEKGKIKDSGTGKSYSITIQFNSEEQWTKALKLMLTNLKWLVTWVSSQFTPE